MDQDELQPGDVIMCLGTTKLSKAIHEISGGRFSHAALWTGEGVLESTLPKAQEISLAALADKTTVIHAFRHDRVQGGRRAIVTHGRHFVEHDYNVRELVIASALGTLTAWLGQASELVALHVQLYAQRLINQLLALMPLASGERVTCVELVLLSHLRAGLPVEVKLDPGGVVHFDTLWDAIQYMREHQPPGVPVGEQQGIAGAAAGHVEIADDELRTLVGWAAETSQRIRATREALARGTLEHTLAQLKELRRSVSERFGEPSTWYAGFVTPAQLEKSLKDHGPVVVRRPP